MVAGGAVVVTGGGGGGGGGGGFFFSFSCFLAGCGGSVCVAWVVDDAVLVDVVGGTYVPPLYCHSPCQSV